MNVFKSIKKNKDLIKYLSRDDIKKKYASSYLGVVWAFIQPVVTILIYWFVFAVGFKAGDADGAPYILWLICGFIPWFFFADAVNSATSCFIEYSFLVKKVVFDIEILPLIKIISSLFVHIFFIALLIIVLLAYGYIPNLAFIQIFYYSFAMVCLIFAITYLTSCLNVFVSDLGQLVGVVVQVGMWLTPMLWNFHMLDGYSWAWIFKLNPMFYIVQGYRSALLYGQWFWESPELTIYFWTFVLVVGWFGLRMFKKLRPHFSDVL